MKAARTLFFLLGILSTCIACQSDKIKKQEPADKVIVAYVTSWTRIMPDPAYITHINYAFGHVTESFDGVRIDNEERLHQIVSLRKEAPHLKVMLSIGGWGSGLFSEMAENDLYRQSFADDCRRVVNEFNLDGIDIDWEYPTNNSAGISSSPNDTENFTLLMKDIRKAIGDKKLLTLASAATAEYIDFRAIDPYVDFINIMTYDMGSAPIHHAPLYRSQYAGRNTAHESVEKHYAAGVPYNKLVLGMPFYGRGGQGGIPRGMKYKQLEYLAGYERKWDEEAQAPYLADSTGAFVCGYENPRSIAIKCQYILDKGLLGGMYWEYGDDNEAGDLRRAVYNGIIGRPAGAPLKQLLVLTERGGQHGHFTDAALDWLKNEASVYNFVFTEINNTQPINDEYLSAFDLIIQLDYPPYTWTKEAEEAFIRYIDNGSGGWIGFHHATLLGEFDGFPMWQWFSDFMGGIRFKNYIAPLADGTIVVEDSSHPVMNGVAASFTLPDDEWYTFDRNPRPNVKVLATVDENTYRPASDIRMGDHPVVWVNPDKKARNVYFLMGHSGRLFLKKDFNRMFRNAIKWAAEK